LRLRTVPFPDPFVCAAGDFPQIRECAFGEVSFKRIVLVRWVNGSRDLPASVAIPQAENLRPLGLARKRILPIRITDKAPPWGSVGIKNLTGCRIEPVETVVGRQARSIFSE